MELVRYLIDKKEDIKELSVKDRLIPVSPNKNFIVSIIGPRRSGKTYFLYYFIKKNRLNDEDYVFVNFEEHVQFGDPLKIPFVHQEIYGKHPDFIFFDEVQALGNWDRIVYSLYEKKRYYIFVTGSSSKLLSYEIATHLRGRTVRVNVYPFSIREILLMHGLEARRHYSSYEEANIKSIVNKHIYTQFPDVVLGNIHPKTFFTDYLDLVIYKDIIERYGIRNRYVLELFLKSVISSHTKEFSVNKQYNLLKSQGIKVAKKTLYNFQKILEDVQLAFFLRKYSPSLKKSETTIPKVYLVDPGLYNFIVGKDFSKSLESIVFLELIKGGLRPNREVFYYKTRSGKEVDFVIRDNGKIHVIEVTHEVDEDHIKKSVTASNELKTNSVTIVTWDDEDTIKRSGKEVKIVPFWKWILRFASNISMRR
ncbi:MAG: ATP-binding protein [Thermoplasmata archaeon]|nr:MAG: ATP-binding protein [Thermoplasmata archaeon]